MNQSLLFRLCAWDNLSWIVANALIIVQGVPVLENTSEHCDRYGDHYFQGISGSNCNCRGETNDGEYWGGGVEEDSEEEDLGDGLGE